MAIAGPRSGPGAFTLLEILIVVTILLILVGASIPAMRLLDRRGRAATTQTLLKHITDALTRYVDIYAKLGDDENGADFVADPWKYLYTRRVEAGQVPFLELQDRNLVVCSKEVPERIVLLDVVNTNDGATMRSNMDFSPGTSGTATHIADDFTRDALYFTVVNAGLGSRYFTWFVAVRSRAGTPDDLSDDLVYYFNSGSVETTGSATGAAVVDGRVWPSTSSNWYTAVYGEATVEVSTSGGGGGGGGAGGGAGGGGGSKGKSK